VPRPTPLVAIAFFPAPETLQNSSSLHPPPILRTFLTHSSNSSTPRRPSLCLPTPPSHSHSYSADHFTQPNPSNQLPMASPTGHRLHLPLLDGLESGAEYLQCQQALQQEKENGESVADTTPNYSQLDMHLSPTAQVSLSSNRGGSGGASRFFEESSVAVPQSPHPSDLSGLSDVWTKSEGGRPVLLTFTPLEQGVVEKPPESEPVETGLLEIQQEAINIFIKGFDNNMSFCYQNSVIQMLCASDSLRAKFLDHLSTVDGCLQSINSTRVIHRFSAPSCCADAGCFICALGWVVFNHRFCGYEFGSIGSNTAPLNSWVRDFRTFSSSISPNLPRFCFSLS